MNTDIYYITIIILFGLTILFQNYTIRNWKKASNLWEKVAKDWEEEARKLSEAIDKHISQH